VFYVPSSGIILNSISASITTLKNWMFRFENETKTVLENCLKPLGMCYPIGPRWDYAPVARFPPLQPGSRLGLLPIRPRLGAKQDIRAAENQKGLQTFQSAVLAIWIITCNDLPCPICLSGLYAPLQYWPPPGITLIQMPQRTENLAKTWTQPFVTP